jgi:hypothetical protein
VATKTVGAREDAMLAAWRWAHALDGERAWAIEDCRHVSGAWRGVWSAKASGWSVCRRS